jgi:hypothetical protein
MKKNIFWTAMLSMVLALGLLLTGCGGDDDNPTIVPGGGGEQTGGTGDNTGDNTGGNTGGTAPSTPTGVTATASSSSSISVSWSAVSGATSYKVYYEVGSSSTKNLAGTANSTSYTHNGLDASTTYYYYIKAVNNAGDSGYSSYSSSASATTSSGSGGSGGTGGGTVEIEYRIDQALFTTSTTKKSGSNLVFNWTLKTSGKTPNGLYTYKAPDSIEIAIQSDGSYLTSKTLAGSAKTYTLNNYAAYVEEDRVYLRITCIGSSGNKISYAVYRPSIDTFSFNYP